MSTGRPLLTTKLPGMPVEYYPFVYLFESETLDGYKVTLKNVLEKKGKEAQQWVLENKNNVIQTKRMVELYQLTIC